jgi:hypothetical protein
MTKQMHTSVKVDFSFEESATSQDMARIEKKVATLIKNSSYEATASFFSTRNEITVVITFDITFAPHKFVDKTRSVLTRLIDSHKQPATYQWDFTTISNTEMAVA